MNAYKTIILTAAILWSVSCEKKPEVTAQAPSPDVVSPVIETANTKKEEPVQKEKTYTSCEELMTALVQSSNASSLKSFKEVKIRIEEITSEKITVELYVTNDISEDSSEKRMADHAVGWLEYFPASKNLQDITFDPEEPEILKYDHSLINRTDITKWCSPAKK